LPTALCRGNDLWIEWTYLIDLDNELFSVNNWITFDLWNIPRERWIEALTVNEEGENVFSFEICPEGSCGIDPPSYFDNADDTRDICLTTYRQYSVVQVEVIQTNNSLHKAPLQLFALLAFNKLMRSSSWQYMEHIPGLAQDSFAFREVAFAILSLATGNFYFDRPGRFSGGYSAEESEGYLVSLSERGEPKLMPLFGSGCRAEHQEPGSSPPEPWYWFEDVLISLVPNTVFHTDAEAAIGKAVTYGLESGKLEFRIVLFSIQNAILLEVRNHSAARTIRRTGIIPICDVKQKVECQCNVVSRSDYCECSAVDLLQYNHSGFIALQTFFEAAISQTLSAFGIGCFPVEVYAKIIEYCDLQTRNTCAKVSRPFRTLCHERFHFSHGLTAFRLETLSRQSQRRLYSVCFREIGVFSFHDLKTGRILQSTLDMETPVRIADRRMFSTWSPVFGETPRPSMMTQVSLSLLLRSDGMVEA
jgi:hypothetical protein